MVLQYAVSFDLKQEKLDDFNSFLHKPFPFCFKTANICIYTYIYMYIYNLFYP